MLFKNPSINISITTDNLLIISTGNFLLYKQKNRWNVLIPHAQDCKVSRIWLGCSGNHHWGNCKIYLSLSQNLISCLRSQHWKIQLSKKTGKSEVAQI